MKTLRYAFVAVALLALAISLGYLGSAGNGHAPGDGHDHDAEVTFDEPRPAIDFEIATLDGAKLSSDDLKGDVVVLDFWATWCGPCLSEIPHYNEIHADYEDEGLRFVGITLQSGSAADVKAFVSEPIPFGKEEFELEYPIFMGTNQTAIDYSVWGFPTTLLVDSNWQIRKSWIGAYANKSAELRILVERLLEERQAAVAADDPTDDPEAAAPFADAR